MTAADSRNVGLTKTNDLRCFDLSQAASLDLKVYSDHQLRLDVKFDGIGQIEIREDVAATPFKLHDFVISFAFSHNRHVPASDDALLDRGRSLASQCPFLTSFGTHLRHIRHPLSVSCMSLGMCQQRRCPQKSP